MPSKSRRPEVARSIVMGSVLLAMAALLFFRLGHYALWDDEAATALAAKGVLRTGDTSVLMDHGNIVAYRNGWDIRGFCDHTLPPLDAYLTALSFLLFGLDSWSARLPFALLGLATIVLILFWSRRESWPVLLVLSLSLLGNVTLILYMRQCRYYAASVFFSTAIAYVYWHGKANPRHLLSLAGLSILLFLSNFLDYLALYACIAVDYAVWKRREWPFSWRNALLWFGPQILFNGLAFCVWNPFLTPHGATAMTNTLGNRLTLFYWYWRDLNWCEFFSLPLLLLALGIGLVLHRTWLVRGCLVIAIFVTVIALISPQPVQATSVADLRYAVPIIPLALALETGALCLLFQRHLALAVLAAVVVFGSNLLNGGPLLPDGLRSTIVSFAGELIDPPRDPYTLTSQWINDHVPDGDSIWVMPDYATYPLMFHAPRALYAWQLNWPPREDFAKLPLIHFIGQEPPDYLIAFGPNLSVMEQALKSWNRPDVSYAHEATIDIFWKDLYRPELFWRSFEPVTGYDPNSQAIYVFKRTAPPILH